MAEALLDADRPVLGARVLGLCATTCRVGGGADFREEVRPHPYPYQRWYLPSSTLDPTTRFSLVLAVRHRPSATFTIRPLSVADRRSSTSPVPSPPRPPGDDSKERFLRRRLVVAALRARGNAFVGQYVAQQADWVLSDAKSRLDLAEVVFVVELLAGAHLENGEPRSVRDLSIPCRTQI